jgi:hypothetical protein
LLYEVKEGFTGKLLLDGFCLTGLICDAGASADDYSAKSQDNSERFHWLLPRLGRDANSLRTSPYRSPSPNSAPAFSKLPDCYQRFGVVPFSGFQQQDNSTEKKDRAEHDCRNGN